MEEGMPGFRIKPRGGGGGGGGAGTKCGRWNPTTEQVKVLTDLFRSGLRTPSTDQIQKISSQLSFYGKIESKNVFYWFQNHKARERQKRRRVFVDDHDQITHDILQCEDGFHSNKVSPPTPELVDNNYDQAPEQAGKVIETLQLFPLNSFDYAHESDRFWLFDNEYNMENMPFTYTCGTEMHRQPPLDLRLSFL